jgi:hypothetical protein
MARGDEMAAAVLSLLLDVDDQGGHDDTKGGCGGARVRRCGGTGSVFDAEG